MTWTHFMDMHSGGGSKEPYQHIYIEAPEDEARVIFYKRFGHSADRVTCTCCGNDYSVNESPSLEQASGFERGCRALETPFDPVTRRYQNDDPVIRAHLYLEDGEEPPAGYRVSDTFSAWRPYKPLSEYVQSADVLVIRADTITPDERTGEVPEQGYVWVD